MTHSRLLLAATPLFLLTACSSSSAELETLLENPLFAEQYYDARVDNMVNLILSSGALLRDPDVRQAIDDVRVESLAKAKDATDMQAKGKMGAIVSDTEEAMGEALLLNGKLYTGHDFQMFPGANVHVYLSAVLDPRDGTFPDDSAIDLGAIHTPFGASVYTVSGNTDEIRSLGFYDVELKRLVGFAQLQSRE